MNRRWLITALFWLLPMEIYCQIDTIGITQPFSPSSFLRQRREQFDHFEQEAKQKYRSIQDSVNQIFVQELAKEWKRYELHEGYKLEREKDSLNTQPDTPQGEIPNNGSIPESFGKHEMGSLLTPPPQQMSLMASTNFIFLDTRYNCFLPKSYLDIRLNGVKDNAVSHFWDQMNSMGAEWFVEQCQHYKEQLQLNDWGVFDFVRKLFAQQFPNQYDAQTIMSVFILNQLGVKAKVGRINQQLVCLFAIDATVYGGVPFHEEKGTRYYAFSLNPSVHPKGGAAIEVVEADFILAERQADMQIKEPMRIAVDTMYWRGRLDEHSILVAYNKNLTDFYREYPCVDLQVYLNASHDPVWEEHIGRALPPLLAGSSNQVEQVGRLMKLIRSNFKYDSDNTLFNSDKFFFCEENFLYGVNDCEDRSVLLAYLVHRFIGLDVVLLTYPEHVVAAVNFTDNVNADSQTISHNGKKYVICDPSYRGTVGYLDAQYLKEKPEVIEMK